VRELSEAQARAEKPQPVGDAGSRLHGGPNTFRSAHRASSLPEGAVGIASARDLGSSFALALAARGVPVIPNHNPRASHETDQDLLQRLKEDGELINPHASEYFGGYAQRANAAIVVEALNLSTNNWDEVGVTFSSGTPTTFNGVSLYSWGYSKVLATLPNYACYASKYCYIPAGDHSIKLRFKEIGGSVLYLKTFDPGGVNCVIQRMLPGSNMISAGAACAQQAPEVTLKVIG
jgi:hypothetical protein